MRWAPSRLAAVCARKSPEISRVPRKLDLDESHRRDDEPLLIDLARHPDAARSAPAHVHVMRDVGHVAQQHAVVEDRRDERDVVEVDAAQVGIVDQDAVARRQPLWTVRADGARHDVRERAEMRRLREGLGDRAQLAVEEGAREIATRLDVGGVGGAPQRGPHLLGDGEQRVADDLEADRIGVGGQRAHRCAHGWTRSYPTWRGPSPTRRRQLRRGGGCRKIGAAPAGPGGP
jgi:hypothetical protein